MSPVASSVEVVALSVSKKRRNESNDNFGNDDNQCNEMWQKECSNQGLRRDHLRLSFSRSVSEPQGLAISPTQLTKRSRTTPPPPTPTPLTPCLAPPPCAPCAPGFLSQPCSPLSPQVGLQNSLKSFKTIDSDELALRMSNENMLILDCRSFMAFNACHVAGAVNVNCCDRFNRRRLQQQKAKLVDLMSNLEVKKALINRSYTDIIVYDENTTDLSRCSHSLQLLLTLLLESGHQPLVLNGGIREFEAKHGDFCANHLMKQDEIIRNEMTRCQIEHFPSSMVLPFLFLGNMRDAADLAQLRSLNIGYVLNVTAEEPEYAMDAGLVYKQLRAADSGLQNLWQFFEEAFAFIELARTRKLGVLVHCRAGVSRSPTIAVAYLIKHFEMGLAEAYKFVKMRRSIISPNLNFMGQLLEFEQQHRNEHQKSEPRLNSRKCESSRIIDSFLTNERKQIPQIQSACGY